LVFQEPGILAAAKPEASSVSATGGNFDEFPHSRQYCAGLLRDLDPDRDHRRRLPVALHLSCAEHLLQFLEPSLSVDGVTKQDSVK
jgi:hypothetical protein